MATPEEIFLNSQRSKFIEDDDLSKVSLWRWLGSMGTNYTCYTNYYLSLNDEKKVDITIDKVRTIIYALAQPFQSPFFYWTLLILLLHRFNFKKPVIKIITIHFVLRSIGDVLDKFGDLMPHYFSLREKYDKDNKLIGFECFSGKPSSEQHPLKWLLTRIIGNTFWYTGEIAGDWYPLLRTRAVVKTKRTIWFVYIACGLFNLSKIVLILYHYTLSPTELFKNTNGAKGVFDNNKIKKFYFAYWVIQSCVIVTSLIYDFTVYYVLKDSLFKSTHNDYGFLKKFRSISEFRILVSVVICIVGLPIVSISIFLKFYYAYEKKYYNLNFSFDDIRRLIANVQYFMIFIDQILLLRSKDKAKIVDTSLTNFDLNNLNFNTIKPNGSFIKRNTIESKLFYDNIYKLNSQDKSSTDSSEHSRNSINGNQHIKNMSNKATHHYSLMDYGDISNNSNSKGNPLNRYSALPNIGHSSPSRSGTLTHTNVGNTSFNRNSLLSSNPNNSFNRMSTVSNHKHNVSFSDTNTRSINRNSPIIGDASPYTKSSPIIGDTSLHIKNSPIISDIPPQSPIINEISSQKKNSIIAAKRNSSNSTNRQSFNYNINRNTITSINNNSSNNDNNDKTTTNDNVDSPSSSYSVNNGKSVVVTKAKTTNIGNIINSPVSPTVSFTTPTTPTTPATSITPLREEVEE